jgi:hypothetical protein
MEGSFCPTPGAATFGQCTRDVNNCFTVTSTTMPCTSPMLCNSTGVVATGTACGCPTNGTTLGTGCPTTNATLASPTDRAVLRCETVGACTTWRILVNCADQGLTAGNDTSNNPACVCPPAGSAPGAPNTVYVDPDPPMAIGMANGPTGAQQPEACRFRSISNVGGAIAFVSLPANAAFRRIVASHQRTVGVHFMNEVRPIAIPAGVELTTIDGPSFNTSGYTIDLGGVSNPGGLITLGAGSTISGFTLLADVENNNQGGAGANATILGCQGGTASAHHLAILGNNGTTGTPVTPTQLALSVAGNCALTSDLIVMSGLGAAVSVSRTATTGMATFTGSAITATGLDDNGVTVADVNARATISGSSFTVTGASGTGIVVASGQATLTSTAFNVSGASGAGAVVIGGQATITGGTFALAGAGARGLVLSTGTAMATLATTTFSLTNVTAASRGLDVFTGTPTLSMTGGSVTLGASSGATAVGVDLQNGTTATLAGVTVTTNGNAHGIRVRDTTQLTVNGASVITNNCTNGGPAGCGIVRSVVGSVSGTGILVPTGAANTGVGVTVGGTTQVTKYQDGINSGDGSLTVNGTVQVAGNTRAGISVGGLNGNTTTLVNITGAMISGNGNDGILASTNIPTQIQATTISGNQSNGVNVAQSQNTTVNGYQFLLSGSTVTGNGNVAAVDGRGVFLSAAGKVGARLIDNHISSNVLEGVRVEGRVALSPTEVIFNGNHINGNLTAVATAPGTIVGGGVFFASGAIKLGQFIGNRVFANSGNEIGIAVPQDISLGNPLPWDLSSDAPGVVDTGTCADGARPNYVYCYGVTGLLGVAVTTPALIPVKIKGMHWANPNPTGGQDFTGGIPEPTVLSPEPTVGVFASCTPAGAAGFCADIP